MLKRHSITKKSFIPCDVTLSKNHFFSKFLNFAGALGASFQVILEAKRGFDIGTNSGPVFVSILSFSYIRVIQNSEKHPTSGLSFRFGCGANFDPASDTTFDTHLRKKIIFFKINCIFFTKTVAFYCAAR